MFAKDCGPYFLLFTNKRLWSMFTSFICKEIAVLVCALLAKGCSPCFPHKIGKQKLQSLSLLFICKGLPSLSFAIHLQRTAVIVFCYSSAKDCVLVFCYSSAKDCSPCLLLFICKGLRSLSFAIHLLCYLLFVSMESRPCFCHLSLFSHSIRRNTAFVTANSL